MEKRYILFDLDGTVTDSYEGIINGFIYALGKMGVEPQPDTYRKCIGPPITDSLMKYYGMGIDEADRGVELFREYYAEKGIYENVLYPDIELMLQTLKAHDKKLMIATAKPEVMAERVLEHFGLTDYFCFVAGVNYDGAAPADRPELRGSKEQVINYILKTNGIFDPENAVMVGDRGSDMSAAKKYGLQTIGAAYGYGTEEELRAAGADSIAYDPMQLVEIIVQS